MLKAFAILLLLQVSALAQTLKPGVYRGTDDNIRLFLKEIPGREGSFLGLIVKNGNQAVPYLVDEFAIGRYGLIPLYNQKNLIGASNYTPSLTASVVPDGEGLRVSVAPNPGNNVGFNIAQVFKSTNQTNIWQNSLPGTYSYRSNNRNERRSTTLSPADAARESQLTIATGDMAGTYVLREVRPGMHLAFKSTLSMTGVEVVEESQWVVVFLKGCFGWSDQMVFINTAGNWSMRAFTLH